LSAWPNCHDVFWRFADGAVNGKANCEAAVNLPTSHFGTEGVEHIDAPLSNFVFPPGVEREAAEALALAAQWQAICLQRCHPFLCFDRLAFLFIGDCFLDAVNCLGARDQLLYRQAIADHGAEPETGLSFVTEQGVVVMVQMAVMAAVADVDSFCHADGLRVFSHELCHLHDLGQRHAWAYGRVVAPDDEYLLGLCNLLWSEYFANRFSFSYSTPAQLEFEAKCLEEHLTQFSQRSLQQAAARTTKLFGYLLGSLGGAGKSLYDLRPDLVGLLRACGVWTAWLTAEEQLRRLYDSGDCWQHESGLATLRVAVKLLTDNLRYRYRLS
jgi:hypothetical protein